MQGRVMQKEIPAAQCLPNPFILISGLDRRRREYRRVGWVYIMRNPAFRDGLLKIGMTTRLPGERATDSAGRETTHGA